MKLKLKLGDLVIDERADKYSMNKTLQVISSGWIITCLNLSGNKVRFINRDSLELTKFGSVNLNAWFAKAALITD
jgi:hypothetical protein